MIESIYFENFKVLRNATLPLQRLTLIVGPNGSGKSTAIQGLLAVSGRYSANHNELWPASASPRAGGSIRVLVQFDEQGDYTSVQWVPGRAIEWRPTDRSGRFPNRADIARLEQVLRRVQPFFLQSKLMTKPVQLAPTAELSDEGQNLAIVLDRLRDEAPERFEGLNVQLGRWLPEFDRVLFETPGQGLRSFALRTRKEQRPIQARNLSDGTLLALAMLCLAYMPDPPPVVCFEEPDHGLHPRLMRDVRDALHRLAYPESFGEKREPVQVIATTHSPILLDLFRDHPEEVVIANKAGTEATFQRLSDIPNFEEILGECSLGDAWYTGILGGVPTEP